MNDAGIFIWLKSIKARLEKHGAANVVLIVNADDASGWCVHATLSPPRAWSAIRHEIKGGSILELMENGNKWVENLNLEEELAKQRAEIKIYGGSSSTQTFLATGATIVVGGGGGAQNLGNYLNQGHQNTQTQTNYQNAFVQAVAQRQLQPQNAIIPTPNYKPSPQLTSALNLKAAVDAAYEKMMQEPVPTTITDKMKAHVKKMWK